jgi:DNA ligase-1
MFPEIIEGLKTVFQGQEIILEGEALAFNEATGESFPFQVTLQRKRKHGVSEMAKNVPLKFFIFDLLFLNGVDYTPYPYSERRKKLIELLPKNPVIEMAEAIETSDAIEVTRFFNDTIERGFEGIVAKRLASPYTAGARNFNWIKLKRSYTGELTDSLDLCIVGYFFGKGARAEFGIGTILAAVYDTNEARFKTVSKIGTGFSEQELQELKIRLDAIISAEKPHQLDSKIVPDVWVLPQYIIQATADEITRSHTHTAGEDDTGVGYALRFPRVIGFIRADKGPTDATSAAEIISLFNPSAGGEWPGPVGDGENKAGEKMP